MSNTSDLLQSLQDIDYLPEEKLILDNICGFSDFYVNRLNCQKDSPSKRYFTKVDQKDIPHVKLKADVPPQKVRGKSCLRKQNHLFKGLKQPAFYTLCDFLDSETLFELRFVL